LLLLLLSRMLPNLVELDCSNSRMCMANILPYVVQNCPLLEKMTLNNMNRHSLMNVDGTLHHMNADGTAMEFGTKLKVINMDDSTFCCLNDDVQERMSDLNYNRNAFNIYPDTFIFHKCFHDSSKVGLERVSIRNAKLYCFPDGVDVDNNHNRRRTFIEHPMPQNALIKFVRMAPTSLKWFRSDLTQENMIMLRSERPDIELVN